MKTGEPLRSCISLANSGVVTNCVQAALVVLILHASAGTAFGAVGCTLNDPDRDIIRLFPDSTGYRTEFITIEERGGEALKLEVEKKLGNSLDDLYETLDVPYAYYIVLRGKEVVGYVHGVNQKGMFGGLQLILATDREGTILEFYYQRISSPESEAFRSEEFTSKFKGLTLKDFYNSIHQSSGLVNDIADPSKNSMADFDATLRGLAKNLILFDEFILNNKYDGHFSEVSK